MERFAPGFRDLILARHVTTPADFESNNANYIGGDITGGVMDLRQLFARPTARWNPYTTPARIAGGFQFGIDLRYSIQQVIAAPILGRRSRPAASDERNQLPTGWNFYGYLHRDLNLDLDYARNLYLNCLSRRTRGDH